MTGLCIQFSGKIKIIKKICNKKVKFYWCNLINKHRLEKWDPNEYDVHQVYRAAVFLNEFALLDETIQVHGTKVVGDQGSLSWAHIRAQPMRISKLWSECIESYPIRNKRVAMIKVSDFLKEI